MELQTENITIVKTAKRITDEVMAIKFSSSDSKIFYAMVDQIKVIPHAKYIPGAKQWNVPITKENIEKLLSWGYTIDKSISSIVPEKIPEKTVRLREKLETLERSKNKEFNKEKGEIFSGNTSQILNLYPFQKDGILFLESKNGRALIADDMGLGKTIQAVSWTALHPELKPYIIVCTATMKINWKREILKWTGKEAYIVYGTNNKEAYKEKEYIIINYDVLGAHIENILSLRPKVLIIDECQKIKNFKAKRTKNVRELGKYCHHIIALSGTPIVNKPFEFFSILSLLRKDIFNSQWNFTQKFCNPTFNGWGWEYKGATNTGELHNLLTRTVMIRRKKEDVLTELPAKQRTVLPVEISNRGEYERAEADIIRWIQENISTEKARRAMRAEILARFNYLKQIAAEGKKESIIEWIETFLETDKKLVLFCTHHALIDFLMEKFPGTAVKLDGRDSGIARQKSVDRFQNDPTVKLFIGNILAAGEGITLTASSDVLFCEMGWTPGEHVQAEDRTHRIGQKEAVNIYYMVAEQTIENSIIDILDRKRRHLDAVLDGKDSTEDSLLNELLGKYQNK